MKFAASIEYTTDKAKIEQVRPAHRKYLTGLLQQGKLAAAGPFMDDSGALIVYEAETVEQAEGWLKADPFHAGGVFVRWTIKPWKTVFGKRDLFPDGGPPPL